MRLAVGQRFTARRTFTSVDVEEFARISGDRGSHHVRPDETGRVMIQGLLTASVPSKIGGDLNYIARKAEFEFVRPVFTGDTVVAEATVAEIKDSERGLWVKMTVLCKNQEGKEVLKGSIDGLIRDEAT